MEEKQYLDLIKDIIEKGTTKSNRTGIDTRMLFGHMSRYSLRGGKIPLLTTKRVFWRGVVEELLWFLRGETSSKLLSDKGVKIWNGNGSREFLDSRGFKDREEGDLGPIYGFQWRHYNAKYVDSHTNYEGEGIDQIKQIIHTLKTDPDSRRIILTAWNPTAIDQMPLPPCHVMAIFNVINGELNCMVTQRSADVGLGVPFNIASYSLLTHILAHVCNLKLGELVYTTADTHIYVNHIEPLKEQLTRIPKEFPTLIINASTDITVEELTFEHFQLNGYDPCPNIVMDMAR